MPDALALIDALRAQQPVAWLTTWTEPGAPEEWVKADANECRAVDLARRHNGVCADLFTRDDGALDALRTEVERLTRERNAYREALETIALAGMSGTGQESPESMTAWHARQAWTFIGIAARAMTASLREGEQEQSDG